MFLHKFHKSQFLIGPQELFKESWLFKDWNLDYHNSECCICVLIARVIFSFTTYKSPKESSRNFLE